MLRVALDSVLTIYTLLVILRIVISFTGGLYNPHWSVRWLRSMTDPAFDLARRVVPPIGGTLDVSGFVILLVILILRAIIGV
ncbi:MAG: YggT family protein [Candidatus Hydrogenedentes bacterium]|nr:YggT family protein [Candidatus Hydrogenedentota bacterium]